jgi:branched-chain amino acid transport system ATP-binding protein
MLKLKNLHVYIGKTHVLDDISLEVDFAEIVALIGANGAGKTTTLMTISGLIRARSGTVTFQPDFESPRQEISGKKIEDIVSLGISHCPEGRQVFTTLTVKENLYIGAYQRWNKRKIKEDIEFVYNIFPRLAERMNQPAGNLSGGEQMMLAIGRALMSRPQLLKEGTTILLVEQNASMALELAHRAYVIETGRIVLSGTGNELSDNKEVQRAYLGLA